MGYEDTRADFVPGVHFLLARYYRQRTNLLEVSVLRGGNKVFLLINIYIAKGEESFLPEIVYKESFDTFEDAKDEMEGQVDDALSNHYYKGHEDDNWEPPMIHLKNEVRIDSEDGYDWWQIIEV
jgi:hypothetical protein|nr:MAG TPA: hypothetical protein [Caudoviricetes sp.]